MSWVATSIGDFFRRRRRAFAVTGGLVGGAYLLGKYALDKLRDTQQRIVAERRDKDNLRRRFTQNQDDCTFTALALLPRFADQLFAALNVEEISSALQRKKTRSQPAKPAPSAPSPPEVAAEPSRQDLNSTQDSTASAPNDVLPQPDHGLDKQDGQQGQTGSGDLSRNLNGSSDVLRDASSQRALPESGEAPYPSEYPSEDLGDHQHPAEQGQAKYPVLSPGHTDPSIQPSVSKSITDDNFASGEKTSASTQANPSTAVENSATEEAPRSDERITSTSKPTTAARDLPNHAEGQATTLGGAAATIPEPNLASKEQTDALSGPNASNASAIEHEALPPTPEEPTSVQQPTADSTSPSSEAISSEQAGQKHSKHSSAGLSPGKANQKCDSADHGTQRLDTQQQSGEGTVTSSNEVAATSEEDKAKIEEDKRREKEQILALWNELKVVSLSRAVTAVYALVLLTLQTYIMLNLIGRYAYLASVVALGRNVPTDGEGVEDDALQAAFDTAQNSLDEPPQQEEDQAGIDPDTERLYLTFSWWLLHRGWPRLVTHVRSAVESAFGQLANTNPISWYEFDGLLRSVRRKVEYDILPPPAQEAFATASSSGGMTSSLFASSSFPEDLQSSALSEVSTTTRGSRKLLAKRRTFLDVLFPTTEEEDKEVLVSGAGYSNAEAERLMEQDGSLWSLLNETRDLIESPDYRLVQRTCLDAAFNVLRNDVRSPFGLPPLAPDGTESELPTLGIGGSRFHELTAEEENMFFTSGAGRQVRLAQLLPLMAKLSKQAFYGSPNEYVAAITEVKELRAFSAVIYSSWPTGLP